MIELGTFDASLAALKVKQVDAMVGALEAGYLLEEKGEAKVLTGLEKVAPKFHTHVVFARTRLIKSNPDLVVALPQRRLRLDRFHESEQGKDYRDRDAGAASEPGGDEPHLGLRNLDVRG